MAERKENDNYSTPHGAIKSILPYIDFRGNPRCLEPCRGAGNIYNALDGIIPGGVKIYCEIAPELYGLDGPATDYLKTKLFSVNIIITNPPFSLWREFLTKSLSEAETVVYLLRLNVMGSGSKTNRAKFWNENRPTHIFPLECRPSFTADGRTDGCDYGWFAWDRGNRIKTNEPFTFLPSIK